MLNVVFVIGDAGAGKDTAADVFIKDKTVAVISASKLLKEEVHAAYGLNKVHDYYQDVKDSSHPDFMGKTPVECYISYSENHIKPLHGKDYFGVKTAKYLHDKKLTDLDTIIVTGIGFQEEVIGFCNTFNALGIEADYKYIAITTTRPVLNKRNDSRKGFQPWLFNVDTITNNSTPERLREVFKHTVQQLKNKSTDRLPVIKEITPNRELATNIRTLDKMSYMKLIFCKKQTLSYCGQIAAEQVIPWYKRIFNKEKYFYIVCSTTVKPDLLGVHVDVPNTYYAIPGSTTTEVPNILNRIAMLNGSVYNTE